MVQLLDNAVQGAERGAALTQRMLSFARRQALDPQPTDIPALVEGLKDLMQRTLGPSVKVETRVKGKVEAALVDANQLELAILNLAVNARDAMPSGGSITIEVRGEGVPDGDTLATGNYIVVALADTGEGMDEATLARATEPFFTTKGVGRGTGLGLSMVHGFAEQLSGQLRLKSAPGVGTTAEVWLPVAEGRTAEAVAPRNLAEPTAAARPLKVLAVDDDALVLMNTAAMLEELGHGVLEATSGARAIDILRRTPGIDVVITDYAMPRMTGRDLIGAIKAEWPDMPVVLATGYAELPPGEAIDVLRLPKPFGQMELSRILAEVTRSRPD
jgi:CheY-like chemotaxis protein/two-component sensor histidine kinase